MESLRLGSTESEIGREEEGEGGGTEEERVVQRALGRGLGS